MCLLPPAQSEERGAGERKSRDLLHRSTQRSPPFTLSLSFSLSVIVTRVVMVMLVLARMVTAYVSDKGDVGYQAKCCTGDGADRD